ncbi:MAG TPA: glycosyltransferase family 2 protein [Phycisphaerae bacterium]|nr:glycosyltransferase family 2 protein [Phycisphaerae bacterium]
MSATEAPLVSIVIPTCNRREVLARCLAALAVQSYPRFEIIVVDDGSTDDTPAMLADFAARHEHVDVRPFSNERHAGANVSRNRGIREARGDIVAFLDSDCIAEPDWLEKLIAEFADPRVAAVTGLVIDPPSHNIYELILRGIARVHGRGEAPRLVGGNMAVRRERLTSLRFDEDARWKSHRSSAAVASPVCDEESIFLSLRARGWSQRVAPQAVVLHDHHYDRVSFFRHAWAGGKAAAFMVYKYFLPPRLDLLPLLLTYVSIPLVAFDSRLWALPCVFVLATVAALLYNEIARKAKSPGEALMGFPLLLVYYHVRLAGYLFEACRLRLGIRKAERVRLGKE